MPNPINSPPLINAPAGTPSLRTLSTTSTSACAGNDSRLATPSNATATPTASKIPIADGSGILDPGWLNVGAWQSPTLLNSWANYGSPYPTVGYRMTPVGVQMRGAIKDGTISSGVLVMTFPSGYRPTGKFVKHVVSNGYPIIVEILSNGNLSLYAIPYGISGSEVVFSDVLFPVT
jgi:hypothetical protein